MQKWRITTFVWIFVAGCFAPSESDYVGGENLPDSFSDASTSDAAHNDGSVGVVSDASAADASDAAVADKCAGPHLYYNSANGHCYEYRDNPFGTGEFGGAALGDCPSRGEYEVTITTVQEHEFVAAMATKEIALEDAGYVGFWIGLTNLDGGTYQWISGEPLSITEWAGPNPKGRPYVEQYLGGSSAKLWADFAADNLLPHICER